MHMQNGYVDQDLPVLNVSKLMIVCSTSLFATICFCYFERGSGMVYIVDHCNTQTVLVTCSFESRFHVIDELSHVIYFFKQLVAFFPRERKPPYRNVCGNVHCASDSFSIFSWLNNSISRYFPVTIQWRSFEGENFHELVENKIFVEKTSADFLLVSVPKDTTLPYFVEKTFANSNKTSKFASFLP